MKLRTIDKVRDLTDKRVFLTVDFNISLKNGFIANDTRIVETLPTINYLLKKGAKIILCSHLGRPEGHDLKFSLKPVSQRVEKLTGRKVHLIDNFWKEDVFSQLDNISSTDLIMLENIRFFNAEKKNERDFSRHLSKMADIFVNDAFGTSHRIHSSIVGITEFLPAFSGFLLSKEIQVLSQTLSRPKKPFVLVIGGAKTPEKIAVIEKLLDITDTVLLGGAIANTFLAAWGFGMGQSFIDYEMVEMSRVVFWKAARKHAALILPQDMVVSDAKRSMKPKICDFNAISSNMAIYDIGPKTIKEYCKHISESKTLIWNGPMGLYEDQLYKTGTDSILKCVADSNTFSILGGGDTITSLKSKTYLKKISHISTGGSAMLSFLENGSLPGIDVLLEND